MTRLVDVAKRAGVSKSTASNVIRGSALVAESTRQRVERAIAETGYLPNAIARSLKARSSKAIGMLVPDLTNPFHSELVVSVERAANELGYAVLAVHTGCAPQIELEACRVLMERRVDGVVIAGISLGSSLPRQLLDRSIPVAVVSLGDFDDDRLGVVDQDDAGAMYSIIEHLCGLGHRRLAFDAQTLRENSGERRRIGFENALRQRGLEPVEMSEATAIVAHNDMQAIALIDKLEQSGRRVPDDVSVVGFDDIPLAAHGRIGLTTVQSNALEMGRRSVELVVSASREGRHIRHRELRSNALIIRESSGRAPT
jgi:LacI family transcriptional regulator, galactose operon repressor